MAEELKEEWLVMEKGRVVKRADGRVLGEWISEIERGQ